MRHPVQSLIQHHVSCGDPNIDPADLDSLELSPGDRARVRAAINDGVRLHREGDQGVANEQAKQAAHEIVASLPEAQRSPDYLGDRGRLNPDEMAAQVPRSIMRPPYNRRSA